MICLLVVLLAVVVVVVDGRMILRWIFRKWHVEVWTGSSWLRIETVQALVNAVMNLRVP
jgi:hypothetical protein